MRVVRARAASVTDQAWDIATLELERVDSEQGLGRYLDRLVDLYGLKNAVYHVIARPGCPERNPALVLTYPVEWLSRYIDQNYFVVDPVLSTGAASHLPFDWSALDKRGPRARQLFGESIEFGVGTQGMTFPIRGAVGDFALFSVTGETTASAWRAHMRRYSRDLLMLANLIHARMMGLVAPSGAPISIVSPREREVLTLGARGHTNKQIAWQLSISERAIRA